MEGLQTRTKNIDFKAISSSFNPSSSSRLKQYSNFMTKDFSGSLRDSKLKESFEEIYQKEMSLIWTNHIVLNRPNKFISSNKIVNNLFLHKFIIYFSFSYVLVLSFTMNVKNTKINRNQKLLFSIKFLTLASVAKCSKWKFKFQDFNSSINCLKFRCRITKYEQDSK